jgi:hypothetical protein
MYVLLQLTIYFMYESHYLIAHVASFLISRKKDMKHGCISPRRFFNALSAVYSKFNEKNISKPPVSLHGQLMWREYNYLMCYSMPNCHKAVGNPIARRTYFFVE